MIERETQLLERQQILADFGELVIRSTDLDEVLFEACRLVAEALGTQRAKILEIDKGRRELLVRAGVGWDPSIPGQLRLSMDDQSSETFAIDAGEPVICHDILTEERFQFPAFMRNAGVRALANVPIFVPGRKPYGLLQVDDTKPRNFTDDDTHFLRIYATILGPVIDRLDKVRRLEEAERRQRQNETRFRTIFDTAPVGLSVISSEGRFLRVNRELARILGRAPDELLGLGIAEVTDSPDTPRSADALRTCLRTESVVSLDKHYRRPDGTMVHADSSLTPLALNDGSAGVLAVTADLTARYEAERMLREREERHRHELERRIQDATTELKTSRDFLQAALDASMDMIQIFEAVRDEGGEIVDFRWTLNNHTSESRYGEVRGERLLARNPGVVAEGIFDAFKRVTETGVPEQAERHYVHEQFDGWFYQSVVKLNDGVATTTKDISDWKKAQEEILRLKEEAAANRLRESEERHRLILESALDYAIFTMDGNGVVTSWPPGAQAVFGWSEAEMIGRDVAITFTPEDRAAGHPALELETAVREGVAPNVRWHLRKDGRRIFIDGSTRPLPGNGKGETGFIKIGQDVTQRREAEDELRENRRRLWTIIQGIPQLVWRANDQGAWIWASPQWSVYTGQAEDRCHGFGWLDMLHPDDRKAASAEWKKASGGGPLEMETRLFHAAENRYRWFQSRAMPVLDDDGRTVEWLGTSTDIDDMRQLREHQQLLVGELQHRTRNLLGVVRSIAVKTAEASASLADFLPLFRARLEALSRINGLLSKLEQGERVTFDELVRVEMEARGVLGTGSDGRVRLEGPAGVRLRSATVQTFALAIHELTTNAVKYGALSNETGRLVVRWWIRPEDEPGASGPNSERLHVEWIETGVADMPAPGDAPRGGGYGRELIERALPYQLKARTTYELRSDGVRCTIDLPLR